VEKARTDALKAVDDVKGRVIESKLQRFDAGQLAAHITADFPRNPPGAVIDRLKQLGRVARLEVNRQQVAADGADRRAPLKVERKPTRLLISLYNVANVAREATNVTLAAANVRPRTRRCRRRRNHLVGDCHINVNRGDPARARGFDRLRSST